MAWFDDANIYFRRPLDATRSISQGDIVIAPSAVIFPGTADSDVAAPSDIDSQRRVTLWRSQDEVDLPAAPSLSADVRWGLVMVMPHNCALEKEWNERIQDLVDQGSSLDEAEARATADPEVDAYVVVAPVMAYDGLPETRAAAITRGEPLGSFPIPTDGQIPSSYVDLARMTTVRWELLSRNQRLGALSDLATAHLGHRLATYFAYRSKSKLDEIEAAIGQRIVNITTTPSVRRLMVGLILEDGSTLTLEGNRGASAPPGPERPARG
jgi:hypothetical protein